MDNQVVFQVPHLFVPTILRLNGCSLARATLAVTILGASNAFGRLSCAIVTLFPSHVSKVNTLSSFAAGVSVLVMVFSKDLWLIYSACAFYGIATAPFASLTTVTLMRLVHPRDLCPAYGLLVTTLGLAISVGPPAMGMFAGYCGNYQLPFCLTASCFFTAGILYGLAGCHEITEYEKM